MGTCSQRRRGTVTVCAQTIWGNSCSPSLRRKKAPSLAKETQQSAASLAMVMAMATDGAARALRVLRGAHTGLQAVDGVAWLVGLSHSTCTVLSFLRCLHGDTAQPDLAAEAGERAHHALVPILFLRV